MWEQDQETAVVSGEKFHHSANLYAWEHVHHKKKKMVKLCLLNGQCTDVLFVEAESHLMHHPLLALCTQMSCTQKTSRGDLRTALQVSDFLKKCMLLLV